MDEAMHPLTILASGLYGRALPPQDGAPIRLVVPWKYGFKGIKSIVKIKLVATQPRTTWSRLRPERIRLLRQRESARGPSALEPGHRAAHRRIRTAPDADVQRLRGTGRAIYTPGMDLRTNF